MSPVLLLCLWFTFAVLAACRVAALVLSRRTSPSALAWLALWAGLTAWLTWSYDVFGEMGRHPVLTGVNAVLAVLNLLAFGISAAAARRQSLEQQGPEEGENPA